MHSPRPVSAENTLRGRAAAALYHNPARMCQKASIRTDRKGERTRIRANRTAKPQSHTPERRCVVKSQAELVRLLSQWCIYFRALRKNVRAFSGKRMCCEPICPLLTRGAQSCATVWRAAILTVLASCRLNVCRIHPCDSIRYFLCSASLAIFYQSDAEEPLRSRFKNCGDKPTNAMATQWQGIFWPRRVVV